MNKSRKADQTSMKSNSSSKPVSKKKPPTPTTKNIVPVAPAPSKKEPKVSNQVAKKMDTQKTKVR